MGTEKYINQSKFAIVFQKYYKIAAANHSNISKPVELIYR